MLMIGNLLCRLGLHDMQRVKPPMTPEEAGTALAEGRLSFLQFLAMGVVASQKQCSRCGKYK